jgi:two-component system, OmpR family, phosphate regulon response regulator PhoB
VTEELSKGCVLVVEDEADIRHMICKILRDDGFDVISAETGEMGLEMARTHRPIVITLDRMLPGMDGISVCAELRVNEDTADLYVIMVTALGDPDDRIDGLQVGADDYISKPFRKQELLLRVKAGARRMSRHSPSDEKILLEYGKLSIDNGKHRVWIEGDEVVMTITEYKLLLFLVERNGNLCSRGELLQEVWELPPTLNTRTVDTHIKRLRQKLRAASGYIQTVRGAGYRFSAVD